jgi:PKHD-type hydroxylase
MAHQSIWTFSDLPEKVIDIVEEDLIDRFDPQLKESLIGGGEKNNSKRNSKNAWVPTSHWITGFVWHYVNLANKNNFCYDLDGVDGGTIQYTVYNEGDFYGWHDDQGLSDFLSNNHILSSDKSASEVIADNKENYLSIQTERIRKLSFVVQLSHHDDYEGGNLQLMLENDQTHFAPRKRGTVIVFDSRARHRVTRVKAGVRKSIVGWVAGPRWR